MGLNLNIRRVVFSAISKYDGVSRRLLTPAEVKQISGRAGRYKSIYPSGKVTALYNRDIKHIQKHLHAPLPKEHNRAAVIIPLYEQVCKAPPLLSFSCEPLLPPLDLILYFFP